MELRAYWEIIRRRWYWAVLLAVAVAGASYLLQPQTRESYGSQVRVTARPPAAPAQPPALRPSENYPPLQNDYYDVLISEFFWDDMIAHIKGAEFPARVRQELIPTAGGQPVNGTFDAKKDHRTLTITVISDNPELAQRMANTAARLLIDENGPYRVMMPRNVSLAVTEAASPPYPASPVRGTLNLGLRALLGLIAGVAIAFLIEYLDESIRTAREAQDVLGLPVLGEIPLARF